MMIKLLLRAWKRGSREETDATNRQKKKNTRKLLKHGTTYGKNPVSHTVSRDAALAHFVSL